MELKEQKNKIKNILILYIMPKLRNPFWRKRHPYSSPDDVADLTVNEIKKISPRGVPFDFFHDATATANMDADKREAVEDLLAAKESERARPSERNVRKANQRRLDREEQKEADRVENEAADLLLLSETVPSMEKDLAKLQSAPPSASNQREIRELQESIRGVKKSIGVARGKKGKSGKSSKRRTRRRKGGKSRKSRKHRSTHRRRRK